MHTAMRLAVPVARALRARRGSAIRIVLFGLYAPLCGPALEPGLVDAVIGGEYEQALVAPRQRSRPIPGRSCSTGCSSHSLLAICSRRSIATRHCSSTAKHGSPDTSRRRAVASTAAGTAPFQPCTTDAFACGSARPSSRTSRGCGTTECATSRSGIPTSSMPCPHALAVARAVHERCPELTFDITTKVEHILEHPSVIAELRDLGLLFIVSAVEFDQRACARHSRQGTFGRGRPDGAATSAGQSASRSARRSSHSRPGARCRIRSISSTDRRQRPHRQRRPRAAQHPAPRAAGLTPAGTCRRCASICSATTPKVSAISGSILIRSWTRSRLRSRRWWPATPTAARRRDRRTPPSAGSPLAPPRRLD